MTKESFRDWIVSIFIRVVHELEKACQLPVNFQILCQWSDVFNFSGFIFECGLKIFNEHYQLWHFFGDWFSMRSRLRSSLSLASTSLAHCRPRHSTISISSWRSSSPTRASSCRWVKRCSSSTSSPTSGRTRRSRWSSRTRRSCRSERPCSMRL